MFFPSESSIFLFYFLNAILKTLHYFSIEYLGATHVMYRIGIGFDVHPLLEGNSLIVGGVEIPHTKGLLGNSDGDVLVHAVIDAILGALSLGDIGQHFPEKNPKYRDANSIHLLNYVYTLAANKGFKCSNLDSVIMAEKPKMNPHILEMRKNLSLSLKINDEQVSIKATTTERLGFIGREEGIAAKAVVLLQYVNE